jgi:glycosyltransferase involved in cell wall biosynthesis
MQAVAPIKLSEYLLCGLPVVGDASVGYTATAISAEVFFADEGDPADAAAWLAESVLPRREWFRRQAREVGVAHFSLSRAAEDYLRGLEVAGLA